MIQEEVTMEIFSKKRTPLELAEQLREGLVGYSKQTITPREYLGKIYTIRMPGTLEEFAYNHAVLITEVTNYHYPLEFKGVCLDQTGNVALVQFNGLQLGDLIMDAAEEFYLTTRR